MRNLLNKKILTLSVATSFDALMVGLSFAFMQISILEPILVIGLVTFLLSLLGFFLGFGLGDHFGNKNQNYRRINFDSDWNTNLLEHLAL